MSDILVETLDEIFEDAESKMAGGYSGLKEMVKDILESCEADDPQTDIAFQFEHLAADLDVLQKTLSDAVAAKLAAKPGM